MKEKNLKQAIFCMAILTSTLMSSALGANSSNQNETISEKDESKARQELIALYEQHARTPSDIYEHIPVLRKLANECSSTVEIGVRSLVSTWGIILGLAESSSVDPFYLGIDLHMPPTDKLYLIERLASANGVNCQFHEGNDMNIDIPQTDMLFIDSLHTYCHLTYELNKFSPYVNKYITLHDTSAPWGNNDDADYNGDFSEYPPEIDKTKRGLWPAVLDFLSSHPDWKLHERRLNNHGFTTLKRVYELD